MTSGLAKELGPFPNCVALRRKKMGKAGQALSQGDLGKSGKQASIV